MPNVGGKKYPYTPKGIAQAEAAKKDNPIVTALMKRKQPRQVRKA